MTFIEYVNKRDAELNEYIGGLAGQALGATAGSLLGPVGTMGGAFAGRWAGDKFDKWVKGTKEKSDQIDPSQKGLWGKSKDWLRNKYLAADAWAEKHPAISNLAAFGASAAGAYGMHHLAQNWGASHTGDTSAGHVGSHEMSPAAQDLLDKINQAKQNAVKIDPDGTMWMKDGSMQDWGSTLNLKLKTGMMGSQSGIKGREYWMLKKALTQ